MIDMIQTLIDKGFADEVNGTGYFRVKNFKEYGKLSHKNLEDLQSGFRSQVSGEDQKKTHWILYSGNRKRKESLSGYLRGVKDAPAGTLNVLLCPKNIWARKLIFTQVARI